MARLLGVGAGTARRWIDAGWLPAARCAVRLGRHALWLLVRQGIAQLVRRGWLRPVGVRGNYEFIPEAAGPFPSGDPWLVLRAALRRRPNPFHVGATSAAWLLGYAQRSPAPHTIVASTAVRVPRPLAGSGSVRSTR